MDLFRATNGERNQFSAECTNVQIRTRPGPADLQILAYEYDPQAPNLEKNPCEEGKESLVPQAPKNHDLATIGVAIATLSALGLVGLLKEYRRRNLPRTKKQATRSNKYDGSTITN
ncbi:MAG: hypothetical protein ACJAW3_000019 [Lentimonas sp.]